MGSEVMRRGAQDQMRALPVWCDLLDIDEDQKPAWMEIERDRSIDGVKLLLITHIGTHITSTFLCFYFEFLELKV